MLQATGLPSPRVLQPRTPRVPIVNPSPPRGSGLEGFGDTPKDASALGSTPTPVQQEAGGSDGQVDGASHLATALMQKAAHGETNVVRAMCHLTCLPALPMSAAMACFRVASADGRSLSRAEFVRVVAPLLNVGVEPTDGHVQEVLLEFVDLLDYEHHGYA